MTTNAAIEARRCELAEWEAANRAALTGSSYTIDGLTVTRQEIESVIRPNIRRLQRTILQLEAAARGATAPAIRVANLQGPAT